MQEQFFFRERLQLSNGKGGNNRKSFFNLKCKLRLGEPFYISVYCLMVVLMQIDVNFFNFSSRNQHNDRKRGHG